MNVNRRFALDNYTAEVPDAIGSLRRSVLDCVLRGKLVERGPADEPVSELLKRIAAEEARMMIAEVLWKPCHLANSADAPFGTPETWCWCRPDVIGAVIGGGTPAVGDPVSFAEPGEGIPWLTSQDPWQSSPTILMPLGIVLFSSRTTIGYRVWEARSGASPIRLWTTTVSPCLA